MPTRTTYAREHRARLHCFCLFFCIVFRLKFTPRLFINLKNTFDLFFRYCHEGLTWEVKVPRLMLTPNDHVRAKSELGLGRGRTVSGVWAEVAYRVCQGMILYHIPPAHPITRPPLLPNPPFLPPLLPNPPYHASGPAAKPSTPITPATKSAYQKRRTYAA